MTVWAYIRVSGDEQADRGLPVAGQRRALEEYAQEHELHLGRVFVDEARSGGNDQREQFQLMMHLAHQDPPPCSSILLWSWSRFARDQDDAHFWKASLRRHGVNIVTIDGETPDMPGGFEYIMEALIHWKDAQKLKEVSHNARRGQQTLAKLGYIPSGGPPPAGFRVEFEERDLEGRQRKLRRWVPDPRTWPAVEEAWRMRLQGASYREIWDATRLYGGPSQYNRFFKNRVYKGELWFGSTLIKVPAAVSCEEWAAVNKDRDKRSCGSYTRRQGSRYILSGLVFCGRCQTPMCGRTTKATLADGTRKEYRYYICHSQPYSECDLPCIPAGDLEQAVVQQLFDDILTPEALERHLDALQAYQADNQVENLAQLATLQENLDTISRTIERLLDSIEQGIDPSSIRPRLEAREAEREETLAEIERLQVAATEHADHTLTLTDIRTKLREAIDTGPPQQVRRLLKGLIGRITVEEEEAKIEYRLPF